MAPDGIHHEGHRERRSAIQVPSVRADVLRSGAASRGDAERVAQRGARRLRSDGPRGSDGAFEGRGPSSCACWLGLVAARSSWAAPARRRSSTWRSSGDLPDLRSLEDYRPALDATVVLDRAGRPIGEFFEERRRLVRLEDLPPHVVQAFVAAEDDTFFEHSGIDYCSIVRAAWANLTAGGEIAQGASTITQQLGEEPAALARAHLRPQDARDAPRAAHRAASSRRTRSSTST